MRKRHRQKVQHKYRFSWRAYSTPASLVGMYMNRHREIVPDESINIVIDLKEEAPYPKRHRKKKQRRVKTKDIFRSTTVQGALEEIDEYMESLSEDNYKLKNLDDP